MSRPILISSSSGAALNIGLEEPQAYIRRFEGVFHGCININWEKRDLKTLCRSALPIFKKPTKKQPVQVEVKEEEVNLFDSKTGQQIACLHITNIGGMTIEFLSEKKRESLICMLFRLPDSPEKVLHCCGFSFPTRAMGEEFCDVASQMIQAGASESCA